MSKKSVNKFRETPGTLVFPDGNKMAIKTISETIVSTYVAKGQSNVEHNVCTVPYSGYQASTLATGTNGQYAYENVYLNPGGAGEAYAAAWTYAFAQLTSLHLSSSSMLETLKEAEKIPSLFAMRTYSSYGGYGAYKWGLRPFLSDVKEYSRAMRSTFNQGQNAVNTPIERSGPLLFSLSTPNKAKCTFKGTYSIQGKIQIPKANIGSMLNNINLMLDTFGVNPDLKTAWELTPFSFIADYFAPLSTVFGNLHPRGWGTYSGSFSGTLSIKGQTSWYEGADTSSRTILAKSEGRYYKRNLLDRSVQFGQAPAQQVIWSSPTADNWLSTAYVASQQLGKNRLGLVQRGILKKTDSLRNDLFNLKRYKTKI